MSSRQHWKDSWLGSEVGAYILSWMIKDYNHLPEYVEEDLDVQLEEDWPEEYILNEEEPLDFT